MSKKNSGFNIIREDSTTHGGYHTGTLNISNLSSILIDGDEARIDLGLIHAKSKVERGIKFSSDPQDVPEEGNPIQYWVVWVAVDRKEEGPYYAGVTTCSMIVNREARRGWKNLAEHVNRMDDALKRRIKVAGLQENEKAALRQLLIENNAEWWENATDELKVALGSEAKK
ncbi:YwhD family protein [Marininema halotolerans]|uniref:YwhD family protein n=1 Tax=Marininema halotolerans TaxID=1155944 RepID=A0A1I6P8I8_9BACL|nr:YwhD family protein [Marininema halotolerans]SFS36507.1 YwhD family protein [Marininema halotolerans]